MDLYHVTLAFGFLYLLIFAEPLITGYSGYSESLPIIGFLFLLYIATGFGTYIQLSERGSLKYVNTFIWRKSIPLDSIKRIISKPGYIFFRESIRVLIVEYEHDGQIGFFNINPIAFKREVIDEFIEDIKHHAPHIKFSEITS